MLQSIILINKRVENYTKTISESNDIVISYPRSSILPDFNLSQEEISILFKNNLSQTQDNNILQKKITNIIDKDKLKINKLNKNTKMFSRIKSILLKLSGETQANELFSKIDDGDKNILSSFDLSFVLPFVNLKYEHKLDEPPRLNFYRLNFFGIQINFIS